MDRQKPRGRQSDATAQRTRQQIVASARTLFAARGFAAVSLREIAEHAGVTHGLLRHHVGAKEDLWRAVIDATVQDYLAVILPLIDAAATEAGAALPAVKAVSRAVVVMSGRYPEVARLLMHESVEGGPRLDYFIAQIAPLRALVTPLLDAVQRGGGLAHFTHDTFLLALLMLGAMPFALAAFSRALSGADLRAAAEIERHADLVIAALFAGDGG
ncbi:MAG TPA: helix-turn-helix domain-containing protein [Herpetosiphonaceae bacterium]